MDKVDKAIPAGLISALQGQAGEVLVKGDAVGRIVLKYHMS